MTVFRNKKVAMLLERKRADLARAEEAVPNLPHLSKNAAKTESNAEST